MMDTMHLLLVGTGNFYARSLSVLLELSLLGKDSALLICEHVRNFSMRLSIDGQLAVDEGKSKHTHAATLISKHISGIRLSDA